MKHKNILRGGLLAFLMMMEVIAVADPARVVSKQENQPHENGNLKTRIFLDTTNDSASPRANAYVDLFQTNRVMSMQEFSNMIQVGDIIEYTPNPRSPTNGRYTIITALELIELNGRNIYRIFAEDLGDSVYGSFFPDSRRAYYEAQQRSER